MAQAEEDTDTLRRIRVLRQMEKHPERYPAAAVKIAVQKLGQVRKLVGV